MTRIIAGSAADRHGGLQAEDRIVGIGQGSDGELLDVRGKKLNEVLRLIRGNRGTIVRLEVIPAGTEEASIHAITRGSIELTDSLASSRVVKLGKKDDGSPKSVGWIKLPTIYVDNEGGRARLTNYASVTRDVRQQLKTLKEQEVDIVLLDLRYTDGEDVSEALQLAGLFIDHGAIVQVRDASGRVQRYDDHESGMAWEGPLILLTNRFTSGTAEIVAAAIQDYRRGLVVGDEATRGQGTTQTLLVLSETLFPGVVDRPDLGALRLTTQQTFRINGESIQQRGVAADVVLPSMSNVMDVSESELDHVLAFDQIPAADYTRLGMANEDLLATLREESEKRRTRSSECQELVESIATYRLRKARSTVTLNEQKINVESKDDSTRDEAINAEPLVPGIDGPHAYLREVIQIALDYVEALSKQ